MATSYSNPGGMGERNSLITISTTATIGGGTISNAIDGVHSSNNSTDAWWWNNGQSGRVIEFDFTPSGFNQIIDEITWYQNTTNTHGDWDIDGWNGSVWINLHTSTLGSASLPQVISYTNAGGYSKYRLNQISGVTSDGPWLQEIEFKIEQGTAISTDITGDLISTELPDVLSFTGGPVISGTLAATEESDIVLFDAGSTITGTLAATEAPDVVMFTDGLSVGGYLDAIEAPDVVEFVGRLRNRPYTVIVMSNN